MFEKLTGKENLEKKIWFYRNPENIPFEPLNAIQMDELFVNKMNNEDFCIQGPSDSEFCSYRMILKQFLKCIHFEKSRPSSSTNGSKNA